MKPTEKGLRGQRGAAILLAMLTVTLVATLAAAALWQQWRSVEVETAERERVQASWILTGALDWARLILREDGRAGGADHLAEPWAVPLEEARLSTFLAADRNGVATAQTGSEDRTEQAFLSGSMEDMQGRLSVRNLVKDGKVNEFTFKQFAKLFDLLNLPVPELMAMAENLRFASDRSADNRSGGRAVLMPSRAAHLVWLGVSSATAQALLPFVFMSPEATADIPLNLNTASEEVLYAALEPLDLADAKKLVAARALSHFQKLDDANAVVEGLANHFGNHSGSFAVATRYFEVTGRLRMGQITVQERSLVKRNGTDVKTLWRERGVVDLKTLRAPTP